MPSLPELPPFEDSNDVNATTTSEESHHSAFNPTSSPLQSTPAPPSTQNTIRLQSSTSSTARFAQSIASRASRSGSAFSSSTGSLSKHSRQSLSMQRSEISFDDISAIPSYPQSNVVAPDEAGVEVGRDRLEDMSLAEALPPPSRDGSPYSSEGMADNGHSKYSYSVSLRSEPKVCAQSSDFSVAIMNLIITEQPFRQNAKCEFSEANPSHAHTLSHADTFPVIIILEFYPSFCRVPWTGADE